MASLDPLCPTGDPSSALTPTGAVRVGALAAGLAFGVCACTLDRGPISIAGPAPNTDPSTHSPSVPPGADAGASEPHTGIDGGAIPDAGQLAPDAGGPSPRVNLVAKVATCTPAADACAAPPVDGVYASYRKDVFLPNYRENGLADPLTGGRFHIAARAHVGGTVRRVLIDGVDTATINVAPGRDTPRLEWAHVWPPQLTAGESVWVAFHSRSARWDERADAELVIETDAGEAFRGRFPVQPTPVPITYVTWSDDRRTLIVHLKNTSDRAHDIRRLVVQGRDLTDAACIATPRLLPGQAAQLTVPMCTPLPLGGAYTVAVEFDGAPPSVAVGRIFRQRFVIEAWRTSTDCPYPGVSGSTWPAHRNAGFDTMFYRASNPVCGEDPVRLVNTPLGNPLSDGFHVLLADLEFRSDLDTYISNDARVSGIFVGDESDGELYLPNGVPAPAERAALARTMWSAYPQLPVYNGGMTNRNIGSFAGTVDIQGMDLYVAACAPHITPFGQHPPLRGAYDYLKNARDNHMPWPTWLYAQGLHPGWNRLRDTPFPVIVQPDPAEIWVQGMSVLLAGGKGLMWFQTTQEEAERAPERWRAITEVNRVVGAVRDYARLGDLTGMARAGGKVLVDMIRSRDALLVPVINVDTSDGPDDASCLLANVGIVPRWRLRSVKTTLEVTVPPDFGVYEALEVRPDGVRDAPTSVVGREVRIPTTLNQGVPARLFVLAARPEVRAAMTAALSSSR